MATSEILPFAQGGGANVQSQVDYAAEPLRSSGNVAGIARSAVNNKALRQASVLAAAVAQFMADNQANNITDSETVANLASYLGSAVRASVGGAASVGLSANASMNIASASATATFTADQLVVAVSLSGRQYRLSSVYASINLATTGAGGMGVGSPPVSGSVAVYVIYNPTTNAIALLGVNATTTAQPEIYGGANMPAGYTASALVAVLPVSSSIFEPATVRGREVWIQTKAIVLTSSQSPTPITFSIASAAPRNAKTCSGNLQIVSSASGATISAALYGGVPAVGQTAVGTNTTAVNGGINAPFQDLPITSPQTIAYSGVSTTGTMTLSGTISKYTF